MKTQIPLSKEKKPMSFSSKIQGWEDSFKWTYLLGWIFIAGIALVMKFVGPSLFQNLGSLVELIVPGAPLALRIVLSIILLVLIPLVAGWLAGALLKSRQGNRNAEALQTMQKKLFVEVEQNDSRGFPVALVNWPSASVRTLGVITSTFEESRGDRELAAVYIPDTPDPTGGLLRVVAIEDLTMTEWSIGDLTDFHGTFGSVCPESCGVQHQHTGEQK